MLLPLIVKKNMKTTNYTLSDHNIRSVIPLGDYFYERNVLIQVFCGQDRQVFQDTINAISKELPNAICIGASSDGEINESQIHVNKTVVSISTFKKTSIKGSYVLDDSSYSNGVNLTNKIITPNTKLMLFFASLNKTNGDEFLKGIEEVDNSIIIGGGLSSTHSNYKESFVSFGNKLFNKGVVGISLNSEILEVHNDFRFNWLPVGTKHTITEVNKNKVYTIDNMNAAKFYEKYLGNEIMDSLYENGTQFSLILLSKDIPIGRVVIDKDDESLTFNGNFKKGDIVKFGFGQADAIMKDPQKSYKNLFKNHSQSYFVYSCMARRRYLPDNIHMEIEPFSNRANTSGFFTHGEFYHSNKSNEFLNHTLTVISLSESNQNPQIPNYEVKQEIIKNDQTTTIRALTSLIEESSKDYYLLHDELEQRVKDRTLELEDMNDELEQTISNLTSTQKQLIESEKMASLSGLVSGVAHELNTPLGIGITGISHLNKITDELKHNFITDSVTKEDFEQFLKISEELNTQVSFNLKRAASLVNNFKQISVDRENEERRKFEIKEYLNLILDSLSTLIKKSNLIIRIDCKHQHELSSYPGAFSQILTNLINNSIHHAFKNQKYNCINIEVIKTQNNELQLIYKDNGQGIKEENIEKIFEPFFTTNRKNGGTGLGLNLIYNIITAKLGGTIECHSEINIGTVFTIKIPMNNE